MTLFMMLMTMLSAVTIYAAEDPHAWKQWDSRWAEYTLGDQCKMKNSGCFCTAIAILMACSGAEDPITFNPGILRDRLEAGGFISHDPHNKINDGNLNLAAFVEETSPNFYYCGTLDFTPTPFSEIRSSIATLLEEGYYCVAIVKNYGHYVAVSSVTDQDVLIDDPGYTCTSLRSYDGGIMGCHYFRAAKKPSLPDGVTATNLLLTVTKKTNGGSLLRPGPGEKYGEIERVPYGTQLHGIGYMVNEFKNLWFLLDDGSYIYSGNVSAECLTAATVTNVTAPNDINAGNYFILTGTVRSDYLLRVTCNVIDEHGTVVLTSTDKPLNGAVDIRRHIDHEITFGILDPGDYTYQIVSWESVDTGTICKDFSTVIYQSAFTVK